MVVPKFDMSDQTYPEFVADRFDEAERSTAPIIFTNRGTFHAKTVLSQIINRCSASLLIFSGQLSTSVYDSAEIRNATRRVTGRVRIIVANTSRLGVDSALIHLQPEIDSGLIAVRKLKSSLFFAKSSNEVKHFCIADERYLRFENDSSERTATVLLNAQAVGDGSIVRDVVSNFDQLWEKSDHVNYHHL